MFFRNLFLFRFDPGALALDAAKLAEAFGENRLRNVGPAEIMTQGFVPAFQRPGGAQGNDALVHAYGQFAIVALGRQTRLLPPDVVRDETNARIRELAEKSGQAVRGRARKRIQDEVFESLLPRAFVRESRTLAYFDLARGWLVINTAARAVAESVVTFVRRALGSFPCVPLVPQAPARILMTDWLANGNLTEGITLGEECELRDPGETPIEAIVRCAHQALQTNEIREHITAGKRVYRLGLCFNDRLSFVLSDDLIVRKLRFLDAVQDDLVVADDAYSEFDAICALQTLELRELLAWLETTFQVGAASKLTLDGGDAPKHMHAAEPPAGDPQLREAFRELTPQKGSGIDSLTITTRVRGNTTRSVTLTPGDLPHTGQGKRGKRA